jgi:hypothetical protein
MEDGKLDGDLLPPRVAEKSSATVIRRDDDPSDSSNVGAESAERPGRAPPTAPARRRPPPAPASGRASSASAGPQPRRRCFPDSRQQFLLAVGPNADDNLLPGVPDHCWLQVVVTADSGSQIEDELAPPASASSSLKLRRVAVLVWSRKRPSVATAVRCAGCFVLGPSCAVRITLLMNRHQDCLPPAAPIVTSKQI